MATDVHTDFQSTAPSQPSVSGLVSGIVNDVQDLVKQHVELLRQEVREDLGKTKQAAGSMILGGGMAAIGGLLLAFMLVYLISWAWPVLALWGAFAIVGGVFAVGGGILLLIGRHQFQSFNPLPDKTLKEIQWTIKPK